MYFVWTFEKNYLRYISKSKDIIRKLLDLNWLSVMLLSLKTVLVKHKPGVHEIPRQSCWRFVPIIRRLLKLHLTDKRFNGAIDFVYILHVKKSSVRFLRIRILNLQTFKVMSLKKNTSFLFKAAILTYSTCYKRVTFTINVGYW